MCTIVICKRVLPKLAVRSHHSSPPCTTASQPCVLLSPMYGGCQSRQWLVPYNLRCVICGAVYICSMLPPPPLATMGHTSSPHKLSQHSALCYDGTVHQWAAGFENIRSVSLRTCICVLSALHFVRKNCLFPKCQKRVQGFSSHPLFILSLLESSLFIVSVNILNWKEWEKSICRFRKIMSSS